MSATPTCQINRPSDPLFDGDVVEAREWERFKWLAQGLSEVVAHYDVARLDELLGAPPTMPGQREKVVVLLALKATPQAIWVLEHLDIDACDESFRMLHRVALRYAAKKKRHVSAKASTT